MNIRSDRTQGMEELGEARHAGAIFGGHGSIEMPTPSWINHDETNGFHGDFHWGNPCSWH
jgi:hypothetical protein